MFEGVAGGVCHVTEIDTLALRFGLDGGDDTGELVTFRGGEEADAVVVGREGEAEVAGDWAREEAAHFIFFWFL